MHKRVRLLVGHVQVQEDQDQIPSEGENGQRKLTAETLYANEITEYHLLIQSKKCLVLFNATINHTFPALYMETSKFA